MCQHYIKRDVSLLLRKITKQMIKLNSSGNCKGVTDVEIDTTNALLEMLRPRQVR